MKLQTEEVAKSEENEQTSPKRLMKIERVDTEEWGNKCILVINLRKFISKLKQGAAVQNQRWLKKEAMQMIGDKACDPSWLDQNRH